MAKTAFVCMVETAFEAWICTTSYVQYCAGSGATNTSTAAAASAAAAEYAASQTPGSSASSNGTTSSSPAGNPLPPCLNHVGHTRQYQ